MARLAALLLLFNALLPPPALVLLAPAPIVTTAHLIAIDPPGSALAMARGSLAARAANLDLTQP